MPDLAAAELCQRLGQNCLSLSLPASEIAARLYYLGPVRIMTQASHAFIEQVGRFPLSDDIAEAGLVLGADGLDLRLNLRAWHWLCVSHNVASGHYSLGVFDRHGTPLLHLASVTSSDLAAWADLYALGNIQLPQFTPRVSPIKCEVQIPRLVEEWSAMGDPHEHFALLRRHGLSRYEGNRSVAPHFARRIESAGTAQLLGSLSESGLELMVFIYSTGSTQIYTGRLEGAQRVDEQLLFDMPGDQNTAPTRIGIRDTNQIEVWRVHKPNAVGGVTSLEVFDAEQRLIVQLFGRRPVGQPEQPAWREWLVNLEAAQ